MEEEWSSEDGANAGGGQVPCCSLGLGVYGNGSKHDISPAACGATSASNDSPAAQWVVKLQPPELSPSPTTTSRHQPGALVLTQSQGRDREEDVSSQKLTEVRCWLNHNWPQIFHQLGKGYNLMLVWMRSNCKSRVTFHFLTRLNLLPEKQVLFLGFFCQGFVRRKVRCCMKQSQVYLLRLMLASVHPPTEMKLVSLRWCHSVLAGT